LPCKTTLRAIIVLGLPRLSLQNNAGSKLGRTILKSQIFGYLSETTLGFILRELRWHGKLKRKDGQKSKWNFVGKLNFMKEGAISISTRLTVIRV